MTRETKSRRGREAGSERGPVKNIWSGSDPINIPHGERSSFVKGLLSEARGSARDRANRTWRDTTITEGAVREITRTPNVSLKEAARIVGEATEADQQNLAKVDNETREIMSEVRAFAEMQVGLAKNFPDFFSIDETGELEIDFDNIGFTTKKPQPILSVFSKGWRGDAWVERRLQMFEFLQQKFDGVIDRVLKRSGNGNNRAHWCDSDILFSDQETALLRKGADLESSKERAAIFSKASTANKLGGLYLFYKNQLLKDALSQQANQRSETEHDVPRSDQTERVIATYSGIVRGGARIDHELGQILSETDYLISTQQARELNWNNETSLLPLPSAFIAARDIPNRDLNLRTLEKKLAHNLYRESAEDARSYHLLHDRRPDLVKMAYSGPEEIGVFLDAIVKSGDEDFTKTAYTRILAAAGFNSFDPKKAGGLTRSVYENHSEQEVESMAKAIINPLIPDSRTSLGLGFRECSIPTLRSLVPFLIGSDSEIILSQIKANLISLNTEISAKGRRDKEVQHISNFLKGLGQIFTEMKNEAEQTEDPTVMTGRALRLTEWYKSLCRELGVQV